jgi:hypothetical protein
MSNKKQTPVSWLVEQVKSKEFTNDMYSWHKEEVFRKALEMESKKQQKYDEMIEMLDECLNIVGDVPLGSEMSEWYKNAKQLIKEAKEL